MHANRFFLLMPLLLCGFLSAQSPTPPSRDGYRTNAERAKEISDGKPDPGSRREAPEKKDPPSSERREPKSRK